MSYPTYFSPYSYGGYAPQPRPEAPQMPVMGQSAQAPGFLTRPVTSREEAVAAQVDFLGPGTIMPDLGHGMIYLKRFNGQTGASDFFAFSLEQAAPEPEPPKYVTQEEFQRLREELEQLKPRKGAKKSDPDE